MSITVYTALAGDYDNLLDVPDFIQDGSRFVCFTDKERTARGWEYVPFSHVMKTNVMTAKHPKILPHLYFPESENSIWIDANIMLNATPTAMWSRYMFGCDIAVHKHPRRNNIREEAEALLADPRLKISKATLNKQIQEYGELPDKLYECGIIYRYHHKSEIATAMEEWWKQLLKYKHHRDQISFAYICHHFGLRCKAYTPNLRFNPNYVYRPHLPPTQKTGDST